MIFALVDRHCRIALWLLAVVAQRAAVVTAAMVEHQAAATAILRQLLLIRAKVALAQVN